MSNTVAVDRRALLTGGLAVAASFNLPDAPRAQGSKWPTQTVRIVVFGSPGGSPDVGARTFAEKLSALWGQPVIVENKPGADGILAVQALLAARDGHTLLYSPSVPYTTNIYMHDELPYRTDDLVPISQGAWDFLGLAVAPGLPVTSLSELREHARANPGKLTWSAVPGSPFIFMTGFLKRQGLDMRYIAYSAFGPAVGDLSQGRIDLTLLPLAMLVPHSVDGRVRLIAVTNSRRAHAAPDTSTVSEQGEPDLTIDGLHGFYGQKSLTAELRDRIAGDIQRAAREPTVQERLRNLGLEADAGGAQDFKAKLDTLTQRLGPLVKAYGAKPTQ